MTTLQPKTTLSFDPSVFGFCYGAMFTVVGVLLYSLFIYLCLFFGFVLFLEETKTVYLPPARKSVLQDLPDYWKHEVSSMPGREKKRKKKIFLHTQSSPFSTTFPPSQKEQSVFVFTYVTHLEVLFTKGGGLQTKSEALALYVCNGALVES